MATIFYELIVPRFVYVYLFCSAANWCDADVVPRMNLNLKIVLLPLWANYFGTEGV